MIQTKSSKNLDVREWYGAELQDKLDAWEESKGKRFADADVTWQLFFKFVLAEKVLFDVAKEDDDYIRVMMTSTYVTFVSNLEIK